MDEGGWKASGIEREREREIVVRKRESAESHSSRPGLTVQAWVKIAVEHEDRLFTSSPSGTLIATRHGLTALDTQPTLPLALSFNLHSNRPHVLACPYTNTRRSVNFFPLYTSYQLHYSSIDIAISINQGNLSTKGSTNYKMFLEQRFLNRRKGTHVKLFLTTITLFLNNAILKSI